ncbi:MAG: conjugal transfer protein TraX, partial [Peptococcaceae bacterium]|nr:conjugal transfer protein TraX [Peptococcaceae bacterium]
MAMLFMLCDHLWGTIVPGNDWLTCIGRVCFPIYAFLLVEGYFHTSNLKKYVKRLLLFAVISEIPFNLAMASSVIYPFHQNVLWSFLIALGLIHCNEKAKASEKLRIRIAVGIFTILAGYLLGLITMVDYYHAGILMVLTFYFFHHRNWWDYVGQLLCLGYINLEL